MSQCTALKKKIDFCVQVPVFTFVTRFVKSDAIQEVEAALPHVVLGNQFTVFYTFWKNKLCSAWARLIPTRISSWNTWLLSVTKFPPTQRHRTDVCVIGQLNNIWWCDYGWERLLLGQASLGVQMWFRMLWSGQARFTASTLSLARKLSTVWLSFIHYIPCGLIADL